MKPLRDPNYRIKLGLPHLEDLRDELDEYMAVLMGREESPVDVGEMTLMEAANVYHARAREIEMLIYRGEVEGMIPRNSKLYKFRTGELRSFLDLSSKAIELGSRRLTFYKMLWDEQREP